MSGETADFTHEAEMGFSHRELLRGLASAVHPFEVNWAGGLFYELVSADRRVEFEMFPETKRSIASITLPVTRIRMRFFGFDQPQYEDFMYRFKKYLQRGGG